MEELLTRRQLALRLGVTERTLMNWEKVELAVIRLSPRCVRYAPSAVNAFLARRVHD